MVIIKIIFAKENNTALVIQDENLKKYAKLLKTRKDLIKLIKKHSVPVEFELISYSKTKLQAECQNSPLSKIIFVIKEDTDLMLTKINPEEEEEEEEEEATEEDQGEKENNLLTQFQELAQLANINSAALKKIIFIEQEA